MSDLSLIDLVTELFSENNIEYRIDWRDGGTAVLSFPSVVKEVFGNVWVRIMPDKVRLLNLLEHAGSSPVEHYYPSDPEFLDKVLKWIQYRVG